MATRFLVVGAGGIGGVVSAHLNEQSHDVLTLTRNTLIADAIDANGFRVRGDAAPGTVRGRVAVKVPASAPKFDFILLATQPPQVEEAARSVAPLLADDGRMVAFQNGLCEERIAKIVGEDRVIGAIVAWGASMLEPGLYDRTSAGGFQIGRLDGGDDARLAELAQVLECIGPTTTTQNLRGSRWSKLAINCAISSLGTIGGDRLGVLMRQRHVRRLALEIMTEVTEVARAAGVKLEKVSGTLDLDWIALTPSEKAAGVGSASLVAKHALLLAVGARYRRLRSSMLAAIERGRPPAIEFVNGEVVLRGAEVGVATPINAAVRAEVLELAKGRAKSSHERLRAFYERTRDLAGAPPASIAPARTVALEPVPEAEPVSEPAADPPAEAAESSAPSTPSEEASAAPSEEASAKPSVAPEAEPESAAPPTEVDARPPTESTAPETSRDSEKPSA